MRTQYMTPESRGKWRGERGRKTTPTQIKHSRKAAREHFLAMPEFEKGTEKEHRNSVAVGGRNRTHHSNQSLQEGHRTQYHST